MKHARPETIDQAEATQALKDSEERFRDFAEASSDWFWEMGPDLRFTYHSERYFEISGLRPEDKIGTTRTQFVSNDDLEADKEKWVAHLADLETHRPFRNFEYSFTTPGGDVRHVRTSGAPVFAADGTFQGYRGTGTDITATIEARQKVDYEQKLFMGAVESMSDGFALFDPEDRLVFCNSMFKEQNPELADNIRPGMTFEDMLRDNIEHGRILDAIGREEEFVHERMERHRNPTEPILSARKDGHWLLLREERTPDGCTFLINTDLTEIRKQEGALAESETMLRTVFDNVPVAIFLKEPNGEYKFINSRYTDWFGIDPDTVAGKSVDDLFATERVERYKAMDRKIAETNSVVTEEVEIPLPSGETRTFSLTKFPIVSDGKLTNIGGVMSDITELKRFEDALELAKDQAEEANRTKSDFFANMSHELRTPLNAIMGFLEILLGNVQGMIDSKKNVEYARHIYDAGEYLLHIINDILDMSKIEAGEYALDRRVVDMSELVQTSINLVKPKIEAARLSVRFENGETVPPIRADERALKQVLLNLLSNAIKFTPTGGEITVSAELAGNEYALSVKDNGIGITPDLLDNVTEPFIQGDTAHNDPQRGTGLGLTITKKLIELHDGSLTIESETDKGTVVTARFPQE
ncbi:MAG: PAS domain S-box protein [Alphaproteobacteria bacterium]|nr:PAS domain S-box protein [Alphaproteobacteria bacterium]